MAGRITILVLKISAPLFQRSQALSSKLMILIRRLLIPLTLIFPIIVVPALLLYSGLPEVLGFNLSFYLFGCFGLSFSVIATMRLEPTYKVYGSLLVVVLGTFVALLIVYLSNLNVMHEGFSYGQARSKTLITVLPMAATCLLLIPLIKRFSR